MFPQSTLLSSATFQEQWVRAAAMWSDWVTSHTVPPHTSADTHRETETGRHVYNAYRTIRTNEQTDRQTCTQTRQKERLRDIKAKSREEIQYAR